MTIPTLNRTTRRTIKDVAVIRWRGGQHPTAQAISQRMVGEGIRPYQYNPTPNFRQGPRSHGYAKILYCVEGSIEVILPDMNQSHVLRAGDCIELPRGVRYAEIAGSRGACCYEGIIDPR
jgi:mannose-6-phosphate isomerase-like protein (cupin superfamily)